MVKNDAIDEFGSTQNREDVPRTILNEVQTIDGVKEAEGNIGNMDSGALIVIDDKGKRIFPSQGPPIFGVNQPHSAILTPWLLVDSKGDNESPQKTTQKVLGDNEVLVDKATADSQGFKIGTLIKVVTNDEVREFKIVGFMRFGTIDGFGGTTWFFFNDKQAGEIVNQVDTYFSISIAAEKGYTQTQVSDNVSKYLESKYPDKYKAITGKEAIEESRKVVDTIFNFFTIFLLVFAGISFLVALIIIINSFAIVMTQRKREYALLRAIGATGAQIRRSVIGESIVIGLLASALGVLGGIGLAALIRTILKAVNFGLPAGSLVIPASAIYMGIIIGTLATFVSAFFPAWHASRVPPIEALRDTAFEKNRKMIYRLAFSLLLLIIAIVTIFAGYNKSKTDAGSGLQIIGTGIAILLLYVVIALPMFIKPFTKMVGSKVAGVLLVFFGGRRAFGITGEIARRNNFRNPRRSAKTSLALMVGVALVVFITVFASSATDSFNSYLKQTFSADIIVGSFTSQAGNLGEQRCESIEEESYVKYASCLNATSVDYVSAPGVVKSRILLSSKTDHLSDLFSFEYSGKVNKLNANEVLVTKDIAKDDALKIGSVIELRGQKATSKYSVVGIIDRSLDGPGGDTLVVDSKGLEKIQNYEPSSLAMVVLDKGVGGKAGKAKLDNLLKDTGIEVNDLESIRKQQQKSLNNILGFVYGLLALSIIIAAIGILNTMSLSILERRKELGLMRAIGTSKSQVRGFVRFESIILAVLGTTIGILFGIGSGYLLIKSLKNEGFTSFSVSPISIIVIVFLSAFIGSIAGAWPAWRATKVDMLKAISSE